MRSPLRLSSPVGWQRIERHGVVVHVDGHRQSPLAFALSVAAGLDSRPRRLDASYLYDATGSDLFERITAQPEYYLTRVEDALLAAGAREIREVAGPAPLVELGSGASIKSQRLLDAWTAAGPSTYAPVDVDVRSVEQACVKLRNRYPQLALEGLAATYDRALAVLRGSSPMTVAFLGSSLGNLGWREYPEFCQMVADALAPGDHFLVGLDLVKPAADLEAAYNDAAGVTAAFTRNLFARMNRELGSDIPPEAVEHVAYYDAERERIEIFAEARRELVIQVPALGREFRVARGERILTEVSHKFRPGAVIGTIERFGFRLEWCDEGNGQFGLFLFGRVGANQSPASSRDDVHLKLGVLAEMRARTLQIVAPLGDDDLRRQHSPLMSPIAWDLGHIAHFEELWLLSSADRPPDPEQALDRVYDPLATPRARRAELALPSVAEVRRRMRDVRLRVDDHMASSIARRTAAHRAAERVPSPSPSPSPTSSPPSSPSSLEKGFALQLVAQHEAQHQETIFQAIALRDDLPYRPAFVIDVPDGGVSRPLPESALVPAGPFLMGTNDRTWAYDNERPVHEVDVPAFSIDRAPVTNGHFFEFMVAGGYSRRALWSEEGWAWLEQARVQAPRHWCPAVSTARVRGGSSTRDRGLALHWQAVVFGTVGPLHPDAPVVHVSWYEADAYARWTGGRLPTEAEWEKAAAWDPARGCSHAYPWGDAPWEPSRANLDQRRLEPDHAGSYPEGRSSYGCVQMLGDVWEWTDSWFAPYPGFESFPYKEYSETFFGQKYRVLRGGSFATRALVARNTFRNWDLPERRQIFAGFRCVRSP